jgi:hypothetical protein
MVGAALANFANDLVDQSKVAENRGETIMEKLTKLIDVLIDLAVEATTYLKEQNGSPIQPALGEPAPKRTRTSRKAADPQPAAQPPAGQPQQPAAPTVPPQPAGSVDMLGLTGAAPAQQQPAPAAAPAAAPAKVYTEAESSKVLFEVTEKFLLLTKNDTPPGKVALMDRMQNHYKVGKLQDLVHAQRVEWIEWLGGLIAAHK